MQCFSCNTGEFEEGQEDIYICDACCDELNEKLKTCSCGKPSPEHTGYCDECFEINLAKQEANT